jgi:hypothetical protein
MSNYEVIKSVVWKHTSGKTASPYGAAPLGDGWQMVHAGWTVKNPLTGQVGVGKAPFKSFHEASVFSQKHKPSAICIGD